MAYQKKYFVDYKGIGDSKTYTLELWQNTEIELTTEEIKGGQSPFLLEMPQLNHKFQVVRGRGCIINLLSATDFKFFEGLKHTDPKEFKVIHKIDGSIDWVGYLNSDMFSEPYDVSQNYIISTTANDGFSLMDRYRFLQSDETNYEGLKSKWELIQICLNKIGLSYNDIRIKLSTTFDGFSSAVDSTILHESAVNCANFYDEDNSPMTMREVLYSILAPYGAFIVQDRASIYITDIHTLAGGGSISFQKFNATTYTYIEDVSITVEKDIYDVGYFGTGHSIDRSGGTSMQRVTYSSYPQKVIYNESIVRPEEFSVIPESFSEKDGYNYRTLVGHNIWQNIPMTFSTFEESYYGIISTIVEHFIYYRYPMSSANVAVLELINNPFLSIKTASYSIPFWDGTRIRHRFKDGAAILITGEMFVKTKTNPYNDSESSIPLVAHYMNYTIRIGDYYYDSSENYWLSAAYNDNYMLTTDGSDSISDRWVGFGVNGTGLLIELGSSEVDILQGDFDFKIKSNTKISIPGALPLTNDSRLKETWIRNIQIRIVNVDGSDIEDSDFEYIGRLNKDFANEGETIELTTGTVSRFTDMAKIIGIGETDYYDILEWTRAGQTFKIEELLLNSLCSNYRANFITLLSMKLKNTFSLMSVFTDTTFLEDNPKMMIKSSIIDYANNVHECSLVEISEDDLTIIRE